jgi:hypothetical protein
MIGAVTDSTNRSLHHSTNHYHYHLFITFVSGEGGGKLVILGNADLGEERGTGCKLVDLNKTSVSSTLTRTPNETSDSSQLDFICVYFKVRSVGRY